MFSDSTTSLSQPTSRSLSRSPFVSFLSLSTSFETSGAVARPTWHPSGGTSSYDGYDLVVRDDRAPLAPRFSLEDPRSDVASCRVTLAGPAPGRGFCGHRTKDHGARDAEAVHDQPAQRRLSRSARWLVPSSYLPSLSLSLSLLMPSPRSLGQGLFVFFFSPVTFPPSDLLGAGFFLHRCGSLPVSSPPCPCAPEAPFVFTGIGSCWSVPLGREEEVFCNYSCLKGAN